MARTEPARGKHRALRHVVLFRMYDRCTEAEIDEMVTNLRSLRDLPGILSWSVERSLDERKGRVIVEDATFASEQHLEDFRRHPRHASVAAVMAERADWLIGNYWCDVADSPGSTLTTLDDEVLSS